MVQGSFPPILPSSRAHLAQLLLLSVSCFPGHRGNELVGENSTIHRVMAHITKANVCRGQQRAQPWQSLAANVTGISR